MTHRVLVVLDGSPLAESILPDARQLAGPRGELILVEDTQTRIYADYTEALHQHGDYLQAQARLLRADGFTVATHPLEWNDVALAIDEAARVLNVDFIACATHGRGPLGRLIHGSVAWRAVLHSEVPVLLRHPEDIQAAGENTHPKRILVPLDGSGYAENALSVAEPLAKDWDVPLLLVAVVPDLLKGEARFGPVTEFAFAFESGVEEAEAYLNQVASRLQVKAEIIARTGPVAQTLVEVADTSSVSYVVMTSHARTGLPRVFVGSVADALVHQLHCAIVVLPALAVQRRQPHLAVGLEQALARV
jgi:nucleotide-binding universal stress UspA family protein